MGVTNLDQLELKGEAGNGLAFRPTAASGMPGVAAVGDDASVSYSIAAKVASVEQKRFIANAAAKTIVDGSATSLFEVTCPSGTMCGGFIDFLVRASNGTDHQAIAGRAAFSAVNKAGTITATVTYTTAPEAKAVSSGTLTLSFTIVDSTEKVTVKVQPTGSLTETTPYTIEYNVQPIRGAVTIL
jgi:hypothetical protein